MDCDRHRLRADALPSRNLPVELLEEALDLRLCLVHLVPRRLPPRIINPKERLNALAHMLKHRARERGWERWFHGGAAAPGVRMPALAPRVEGRQERDVRGPKEEGLTRRQHRVRALPPA